MIKHIVPVENDELQNARANYDREAYLQGREDSFWKLPRQPDVYYTEKRLIDCYNMGYSSGEL